MSGLDSLTGNISIRLTPDKAEQEKEEKGKWSSDSKKSSKRQRIDSTEKTSPGSSKMTTRSAKVSILNSPF